MVRLDYAEVAVGKVEMVTFASLPPCVRSTIFQLTATLRWLLFITIRALIAIGVSTHSHANVAAPYMQKHCAARLCYRLFAKRLYRKYF